MVEKYCGHLIPSDDEINVGVTRKNREEPPPLPSEEPHLALNCEKLHALVWANPLLHAARELGISDVSLKRHCRKLEVLPPQGYRQTPPSRRQKFLVRANRSRHATRPEEAEMLKATAA
jgi:hypothetical protein